MRTYFKLLVCISLLNLIYSIPYMKRMFTKKPFFFDKHPPPRVFEFSKDIEAFDFSKFSISFWVKQEKPHKDNWYFTLYIDGDMHLKSEYQQNGIDEIKSHPYNSNPDYAIITHSDIMEWAFISLKFEVDTGVFKTFISSSDLNEIMEKTTIPLFNLISFTLCDPDHPSGKCKE